MTAVQSLRGPIRAIVLGASAGGIEALNELLPALPAQLPVPVFVVQHLIPDRPSLLPQLFAPRCRLPLVEALDKTPIEAGVVYFAPPDYHLLIDREGILTLSVDEPVHFSRPSIDVLFESASEIYGEGLLAVLLTGANEDGAAGIHAVSDAGGQTIVQNPATAQVAIMPNAALALTAPTLVLNLAQIVAILRTLPEICW